MSVRISCGFCGSDLPRGSDCTCRLRQVVQPSQLQRVLTTAAQLSAVTGQSLESSLAQSAQAHRGEPS